MSDSLRVATWNIHKGIGTDRTYRIDRTLDVLRSLDADVVCLQEVDEFVPRSDLHRQAELLARELGYEHFALGLNVAVRGGHYGNCTLSKRALHVARNVDLTIPFRKRRGGLVTRVDGKAGRHWVVANVHLGLLHLERKIQMRAILASLFEEAGPGEPVLVAGDSNDWGNRLHARIAAPAGFQLARLDCHRGAGIKTFPSRRPLAALDKILFRPPAELHHVECLRDERTREASDHLPLVAEFRCALRSWAPRAGAAREADGNAARGGAPARR